MSGVWNVFALAAMLPRQIRSLSLFTVQQEEDKCSAVTCGGAWRRRWRLQGCQGEGEEEEEMKEEARSYTSSETWAGGRILSRA